jgi:5'-methylthioadenosine phosphorylase
MLKFADFLFLQGDSDMEKVTIGVIGGSGLYHMKDLEDHDTVALDTPFGTPSDEYHVGTLHGRRVAFLPRHGKGHRINPSELPFRANIHGFKQLGVEHLISVSAVGSMKEHIAPGHLAVPDQFIDMTRGRDRSFFGDGVVGHIPFDKPVCRCLGDILHDSGAAVGAVMHKGGTYICIEGPQFSTLAESRLFRSWGVDVIGMTNLPEARLAREAEICYATLALATDYDCWHEEEDVSVEQILKIISSNVTLAQNVIRHAVQAVPTDRDCPCATALRNAVITSPDAMSAEARNRLSLLMGNYWR